MGSQAARRVTAAVVLFLWVGGVLLQAGGPHVPDNADPSCVDPTAAGSKAATQIDSGSAVDLQHCAICHLQRAVRSALLAAQRSIGPILGLTTEFATYSTRGYVSAIRQLASRGPPIGIPSHI